MSHYVVKFVLRYQSVIVLVGLLDHFLQLMLINVLSQVMHHFLQGL